MAVLDMLQRVQVCRRTAKILEGRGLVLRHGTKRRSGVSSQKYFEKCFGALYCICYIKIINFENFKVLLFSLFLFEKQIFATLYKHTENLNLLLFVVE